ncbi:MAG: pentapeptide repeat-containing protein [Anaerolineae bacterium]|nr:pentapeptide repeat-containing protein [Anaerolineae bacterium]
MGIFDTADAYSSQEFKKVSLKQEVVRGKEFDSCTFTRCTFQETTFLNCKFNDCTFLDCNFKMVSLNGSTFLGTRFEQSELVGINWTETTWRTTKTLLNKPVDFVACVINYSVFIGLNLTKVNIVRCSAKNVAFDEANLTKADCSYTDFEDSRFVGTNLTEADFTGATHYAIDVRQNTVKKAKFSLPEAMSLLRYFDITLTDARR